MVPSDGGLVRCRRTGASQGRCCSGDRQAPAVCEPHGQVNPNPARVGARRLGSATWAALRPTERADRT